jgi:hypothetical protein
VGAGPLPLGALAAAAVALAAAPAVAQDPVKPVVGCAGEAFTDPRGDEVADPLGLGFGGGPAPNLDVTGGFFRTDGDVVTANIRIADLSTGAPGFAEGVGWFMFYIAGGALRFVAAETGRGEEVTYAYGTLDRSNGLFTNDGATTGRLFGGPDGIVQIEVPPAAGATPGATLGMPYAEADVRTFLVISPADQAPDDLRGANYTVGACSESGGQALPPAVLPVRAPAVLGSAKQANRTRRLAFRVRSSARVTSVRFVLRPRSGRGRALATGRLRRLNGAATLRMRVLRPLRRGTYALKAVGTVAGARATYARQVIVRR